MSKLYLPSDCEVSRPVRGVGMAAEGPQPKICRRCGAGYAGARSSKHCPTCRPIVFANTQARCVRRLKEKRAAARTARDAAGNPSSASGR